MSVVGHLLRATTFAIMMIEIGSEPTTAKYTYNSSDISYLSNGIQFPVFSERSDNLIVEYNGAEGVSEMKWFAGLYDQHNWFDRLDKIPEKTCKEDMAVYLFNLLNGTSWAAKAYDSSGRYSGQFFFGNDYWLGSMSLCYELQNPHTNSEVPPFDFQFYVAKIRININANLTPVTRQLNLGQCLPKSCKISDVKTILIYEKSRASSVSIVNVRRVPGDYSLLTDVKVQIVGGCGLATVFIIIVASVVEVSLKNRRNKIGHKDVEFQNNNIDGGSKEAVVKSQEIEKQKNNIILRLLLSFSALTNGRKIMSVERISQDAIGCIHGLRFFSITWIILVHTYLEVFAIGRNKSLRTVTERGFMYQTISNATFSVDTFFFISGLLVTLIFFRTDNKKIKSIKQLSGLEIFGVELRKFTVMVFYRFVRLTPAYLFVLGANEIIMRYIHNNSVFSPAILDHVTCDVYWWRNILYINNFFPQAEFCMIWSWYMANDTQFFIIAAILLPIAVRGYKHLKFVAIFIALLMLLSWITTFLIAMRNDYVARVEEPFALFDQLYDKPWMRVGSYLVGIIIGYLLFKINCQLTLKPMTVVFGWTCALTCLGTLVYGLGKEGLTVPASAFYVALGHTAWGLAIAWITVACCTGYGGPFNCIFSCKLFLPLSRLTYGAYLVHPVIMCLTSFALDGSLQLHNVMTIVIFFGNVVVSFMCAFLISVAFEAPAVNLLKVIFN
ncbi:nose resistant to fluoxetine protein 6-like [Cylas formicarius]|uniref:nose resistant to fluoxetine protein 6-like n=1 Tax=Cylas formicarius TaxID=197179 RepID=UPI002958507A|nr:nose resistant to fluoxetine protein 6-like [Cylas formicarius]